MLRHAEKELAYAFRSYLRAVSGLEVSHEVPIKPSRSFVSGFYDLASAEIDGAKFGIIYLKNSRKFTPAEFRLHLASILPDIGKDYVLVSRNLSSFVRPRLIEYGIPFVVPGIQINWPQLGAIHRARAQFSPPPDRDKLSPITQTLVIAHLMRKFPLHATMGKVATTFHYSAMSISRAAKELAAFDLAISKKAGNNRRITFPKRAETWNRAKELMQTPIMRRLHVHRDATAVLSLKLAGETALARLSMLSPPKQEVWATGPIAAASLEKAEIAELPPRDPESIELQVWSYDPVTLTDEKTADPFSLWLSMKDEEDPRIQEACTELLERMEELLW